MTMTIAMAKRSTYASVQWKYVGDGYWTGRGIGMTAPVCYVAVPLHHSLKGISCWDVPEYGPDVNGGLTFVEDNVFGWDYAHYQNRHDYDGDMNRAVSYFRHYEFTFPWMIEKFVDDVEPKMLFLPKLFVPFALLKGE